MHESPGASTGAHPKSRRGLWVVVFLFGGVVAIFSIFLSLFDLAAGWPWIAASSALVGLAGYSIWRADHPRLSARRTIIGGLGSVVAGAAGIIAMAVVGENLALAGIVLTGWFLSLLGVLLMVDRVERGYARDRKP